MHDENHIDTSPSEKLIIRDIPIPVPNDVILQALRVTFPDHTFKSDVIKARDEVRRNVYSKFITGDRFIYLKSPLTSPFPHTGVLLGTACHWPTPSINLLYFLSIINLLYFLSIFLFTYNKKSSFPKKLVKV